ncbi:hypothetical protein DAEQUDRAFT_433518 [Daedalea quercina L-15889]|uniref:Uncharacterized protein n=1 Tax=Daedalea quercina L-15889 TaxID=1314783 RepID=A0A165NGP9_9APHY|nr:hypothetical protein DAEQUDRAFT_433518 [Daedalea quercina L-15889]
MPLQESLPPICDLLNLVKHIEQQTLASVARPELPQLTAWNEDILVCGVSCALLGTSASGKYWCCDGGWLCSRESTELHRNDVHLRLHSWLVLRSHSRSMCTSLNQPHSICRGNGEPGGWRCALRTLDSSR